MSILPLIPAKAGTQARLGAARGGREPIPTQSSRRTRGARSAFNPTTLSPGLVGAQRPFVSFVLFVLNVLNLSWVPAFAGMSGFRL